MAFTPPTFGTAIPPIPKIDTGQKERDEQDRIKCINSGGKWDEKTKTCDIPIIKTKDPYDIKLPEQPKQEPPKVTSTKPEIILDKQGNKVGITLPDGRIFYDIPVKTMEAMAAAETQRTALLEGTQPYGTAQAKSDEAFRIKQLTSQIGQLTPEQLQRIKGTTEQAPINWQQAITAGTIGEAPSIITSAAGGALAGGLVGSKVGAIGGPYGAFALGTLGAIAGIWRGIASNIKTQQRGEIGASMDALTNARTNMMKLSRIVSTDPSKAQEAVDLYNEQLALVYIARAQTKLEVQGNLNSFMEDGRDILSNYDLFLMDGGQADIYGMRLRADLSKEVPLTEEEILSWEAEE